MRRALGFTLDAPGRAPVSLNPMTINTALRDILKCEGAHGYDDLLGPTTFGNVDLEYQTILDGAAMAPLARNVLRVAGADRVKILNNLATNDIKLLAEGQGCESFLTNVKGHVVGFVTVFATADALLLETAPGQVEKLIPHIDRYIIREDAALTDLSPERTALHLMGPQAESRLREWLGPQGANDLPVEPLAVRELSVSGGQALLVRYDLRSANDPEFRGYRLICDAAVAGDAWRTLRGVGFSPCGRGSFEAARIRARFPEFGRDISDENLPQEVDRDRLAISFKKGCYLGQETVARIDALGHVNKKLVRLRFEGSAMPDPGLELMSADGKPAGQVTSCAVMPGENRVLALAYIRRGVNAAGSRLESPAGSAVVM